MRILLSLVLLFFALGAFSQTTIADNSSVSGEWTLEGSPYIIEGRAIIPQGEFLTIEAGVEIKLASSASPMESWFEYESGNVGVIRVQGELIANGTSSDPILFTRNNTGYWGAILFDETASQSSSMTHCVVEYAKYTRLVPGISNVVSFSGGVSFYNSQAINFSSNIMRNNQSFGLYVKNTITGLEITNCEVHHNGSSGIMVEGSNVNIINNHLYQNAISSSGQVFAVGVTSGSSAWVVGNLIYDNQGFGIFCNQNSSTHIVNNTIYNNYSGIRVEGGANTYIHNSIIQNNDNNFQVGSPGGAVIEMHYSLTNNSTLDANITNVAGNILSSDAGFVNPAAGDFTLPDDSPAIDAGGSDTTGLNLPELDILGNQRIDNGIIDIGAIEFQHPPQMYIVTTSSDPEEGGVTTGDGTYQEGTTVTITATANSNYNFLNWTENDITVSTDESYSFVITGDRDLVAVFELITGVYNHVEAISIYPNPTSGLINIQLKSFATAKVYDQAGKLLLSTTEGQLDLSPFKSGTYILKIETESGDTFTHRVIKY